MSRNLYEALEITPVSTSVADVLPGLQSGLIGAVVTPPSGVIAMQWHPHIRHRLDVQVSYSLGLLVITTRQWKKLPEEARMTVRSSARKRIAKLNVKTVQQNREALQVLEERGVVLTKVDPKSRQQFQDATASVARKMSGTDFSPEILEKIRGLLREYRRKSSGR